MREMQVLLYISLRFIFIFIDNFHGQRSFRFNVGAHHTFGISLGLRDWLLVEESRMSASFALGSESWRFWWHITWWFVQGYVILVCSWMIVAGVIMTWMMMSTGEVHGLWNSLRIGSWWACQDGLIWGFRVCFQFEVRALHFQRCIKSHTVACGISCHWPISGLRSRWLQITHIFESRYAVLLTEMPKRVPVARPVASVSGLALLCFH